MPLVCGRPGLRHATSEAGVADFIEDTFNRSDQTPIGTCSDGGEWTITFGYEYGVGIDTTTPQRFSRVESNRGYFADDNGYVTAMREIPETPDEYEFSFDLYRDETTGHGSGDPILMGTTADWFDSGTGDGYYIGAYSDGSTSYFVRKEGGSTAATSDDFTLTSWSGTSSRITIRRSAAGISLLQDGTLIYTWADPSPLPPTYWVGIVGDYGNEWVENFWGGPAGEDPHTTYSDAIFSDNFNRSDRPLESGLYSVTYSPPDANGGAVISSGTVQIINAGDTDPDSDFYNPPNGGWVFVLNHAISGLEMDLIPYDSGSSSFGIVLYSAGSYSDNRYLLALNPTSIGFGRMISGINQTLFTLPTTGYGTRMGIRFDGTSYTVTKDGATIYSGTDLTPDLRTNTLAAFYLDRGSAIDNITVY